MKHVRVGILFFVTGMFVLVPFFAFAQIVPCDGPNCNFNHLVNLVANIVDFITMISVFVATLLFGWAGWLYVTAGGKPDQIKKAHGIFTTVFWGFVIILTAWLIVNTITNAFLDKDVDEVFQATLPTVYSHDV